MSTNAGTLYLVPSPLDFGCEALGSIEDVLPPGVLRQAASTTHWVVENARSARAFLKRVDAVVPLAVPLQAQQIVELPRELHKKGDHLSGFDARPLLTALAAGRDTGLLSEAGLPAVADPGSSVVRAAHRLGARVVPLVGPSSLMLSLAASGLNGQSFAFEGYLPQEAQTRAAAIRELEARALRTGQTQLFIETPYRNTAMIQALMQVLQPRTWLAVAAGLTLDEARIVSREIRLWREQPPPDFGKLPAVFAIGR